MKTLFKENWKKVTIGDISVVKRGASPRPIQDSKWWGGEIGWVRISDVTSSRKYLNKTQDYLSEIGVKNSVKIRKGNIILSICATIGRPIITNCDVCIHDGFVWFENLSNDINREFFYYLLSSKEEELVSSKQIGTQGNLNTDIVSKLEILLPPASEQGKIAEILSKIDNAIAQTEALIAKQQRIKTGLMQDLLTKGIDENGNIRSEETHEFKDSAIGRIPVEWNVLCLANLLESIYQGWSPDCELDSASEDEWGILKTTAVTWDGYDSKENKKLPSNLKPRPLLEIKTGDVLVTRAGPNSRVGVISYVYETLRKKILCDKIYRLKFKENLEPRFFAFSLSGFASQRYLSTLKTGMAESQTNISQEIIQAILTVVPSPQEQCLIANLIDQKHREYKNQLEIRKKLYSIKTGLMQDLLTGKVRVTSLLEST